MKRFVFIFCLLTTLCISAYSQASGLADLKFGRYQIADSQWNVSACTQTNTCQIYSKNPGTVYKIPWTSGQLAWATGDYVAFVKTGDATNPYNAIQYSSNGTQKSVMGTGRIINMGTDYFFFVGNDNNTGQLFSMTQGFSNTSGITWTGTVNPTIAQVDAYATNGSTTPLAAGQTSTPPPPAYVSAITSIQQSQFNAAVSRRNNITQNSIHIDQVGSNNTLNIEQKGNRNMVAGIGANAMPIHGDWNTVIIKQGNIVNPLGKNLVEANLYGSFNNLNLGQSQSTFDQGGHMQTVNISGNSNSVTTDQRNTAAYGHYLSTNISGNNNTQNITQVGNSVKQTFIVTSGSGNNLSALQDGLGAHYLDVTMNGNSNDAVVNQIGNTKNAASIILNNQGAPASVTVNQSGGQTYNIERTCTTSCGRVTISQ